MDAAARAYWMKLLRDSEKRRVEANRVARAIQMRALSQQTRRAR